MKTPHVLSLTSMLTLEKTPLQFKDCPIYKEGKAILKIFTEEKLSFLEAQKKYRDFQILQQLADRKGTTSPKSAHL
jgi:hypothetical protein